MQLAPDWPLKQEFIANWKAVTNFFVEKKGVWYFICSVATSAYKNTLLLLFPSAGYVSFIYD